MKIWEYIHSKELILSLLLLACAALYLNPMHVYMFTQIQKYILGVLVFVVAFFTAFVVHETSLDERERMHMDIAGRVGYTFGIMMLTIKILVDNSLAKEIDSWIVFTLLVMVLSKVVARVWGRIYR